MKKNYIIDTNVLIDNPDCVNILHNDEENKILIPLHVLLELDNLKKQSLYNQRVKEIIDSLESNIDKFEILKSDELENEYMKYPDLKILKETQSFNQEYTYITNDKILRLISLKENIKTEYFKKSAPFMCDGESFSGILSENENIDNYYNFFKFIDGRLYFFKNKDNKKLITYNHECWKIKPRNSYQNMMLELLSQHHIFLTSIQSNAGLGKTILATASGFHQTFQEKKYDKIIICKSTKTVGDQLGFLPGNIDDKIKPFFNYIDDIIRKLYNLRNYKKIYISDNNYNPNKIEFCPTQYLRGRNIENSYVIIDEVQNISRYELRTILTRLGNNCKCVCIGDINQIDNINLNKQNNGLNWLVKKMLGHPNYAHFILKGTKSRGPICDMMIERKF